MKILNIDISRIPAERLKNGKYCDLVLIDRPSTKQNGMEVDGFVTVGVSKDERAAGVRGEIIGDWWDTTNRGNGAPRQPQQQRQLPTRPLPQRPTQVHAPMVPQTQEAAPRGPMGNVNPVDDSDIPM